jgi:hypothetical protein
MAFGWTEVCDDYQTSVQFVVTLMARDVWVWGGGGSIPGQTVITVGADPLLK